MVKQPNDLRQPPARGHSGERRTSSWLEKASVICQAATAVATIVLAVSVLVAYWGIREDHTWKRRSYTADLIEGFDRHVSPYRRALSDNFFGVFRAADRTPLTAAQGTNLWLQKANASDPVSILRTEEGVKEIRADLVGMFNYFEYLAQSYREGVVDRDVFEESLADPIVLYYDYLNEFVKASQGELRYSNWKPVGEFVTLMKNRAQPMATKPSTGQ